jgi:hypothetical protein
MTEIFLDPVSVHATSRTLTQTSGQLLDASNSTSRALRRTAALPPEFRGRAEALGDRVRVRSGRMADLCAAMSLELKLRADMIDSQTSTLPAGPGGTMKFDSKTRLDPATSRTINFWNKATRAAVAQHPGTYATQLKAMVSPPKAAKAKATHSCSISGPEFEKSLGLSLDKTLKELDGPNAERAWSRALQKNPDLSRLSFGELRKMAAKYGLDNVEAFFGAKAQETFVAASCTYRLPDGSFASAAGSVTGGGELGVHAGAHNGKYNLGAGGGISVVAEGTVSAGNETASVSATAGGGAGLAAGADLNATVSGGKIGAKVDLTLIAGLGGHVSFGGEIDLGKLVHHAPPPPPPPVPAGHMSVSDGALVISEDL